MAQIYTTTQLVRPAAGMQDNQNITDEYIETKIEIAQGIIDGKLGDIYVVPFTTSNLTTMVESLALNLTVSLLYIDQYGDETEGTGIDGQKMFDEMMDLLDMIWKQQIKLRKADGTELTRVSTFIPSGYPNNTSTSSGETCRKFTMKKKF